MADHNSYLAYKRDTRHLIYWMIRASNSIIQSSTSLSVLDGQTTVNTTGQVTVSALVSMSKLIGTHISPIPSTIYRLFQSVIAVRSATHAQFQQIVAKTPDPEIERSNASHKHFIDCLTEAFKALGGEAWTSKQKSETENQDEEDVDEVIFTNKISSLGLNGSDNEEEVEDTGNGGPDMPQRSRKKSASKGKKAMRGKRGKGQPKSAAKETSLDEVPLGSYRIVEDESGILLDYVMAALSLVIQWSELRDYVQSLWRQVSYSGLNSAVAGTLSNAAIAMVKQTETAIFVDFPRHDSYETVLKSLTYGDPENIQSRFQICLYSTQPDAAVEAVRKMDDDIKEKLLIHAYWDLLDFIMDFQKNRSGKPTKRMLSEIRNWDPSFHLQRASKEERIKWRRVYTINWLYDLVNVFSSAIVQHNTIKGQGIILETVDWSINGPWNEHRRLFGLNEFAGDITSFAMQKPDTDARQKIRPHHVFQMQCIVDSLTVSRGWSISTFKGHILHSPARGFRPRRDVELFMGCKNGRIFGHGYRDAVNTLTQLFEKNAMLHGDPNRHQNHSKPLRQLRDGFVNFLGESKYVYGLETIPPSRFSNSNSNGLWEYSPFLCGVGLMEALELAYGVNSLIWDEIREPMCIMHLYNMLVQKGHISREIELYAALQQNFATTFFTNGEVPTSHFIKDFLAVCREMTSPRATFKRRTINRTVVRTAVDLHGRLNRDGNCLFKVKSFLRLCREAEWVPERIPDAEIEVYSALGMTRIGQTKQVVDPATGKKVVDNTPLVRRARSAGADDQAMLQMSSVLHYHGFQRNINRDITSGRELLKILELDIINDISGKRPLSGLNYASVTVLFMGIFQEIEEELKRLRNPLWIRAYEQDPTMMEDKRFSLTMLALLKEDDECLAVMARAFENQRASMFVHHIYWGDVEHFDKVKSEDPLGRDELGGEWAECKPM